MNRAQRRQAERVCKSKGHLPKTGNPGERYCARCLEPMPPNGDDEGGSRVREPRRPAPDSPPMAMSR